MLNNPILNDISNPIHNIVDNHTLKIVQGAVLRVLKDSIIHSMGPAGSNAMIIKGNDEASVVVEYSKDGNKIIKNFKFTNPIEFAIKEEIETATKHIEKEVGDGTSSIVVMSSIIFDQLQASSENNKLFSKNPYEIMRQFKKVVELVSSKIRENGRKCTLDDIYNIAYISTNGNEDVANTLRGVYQQYGMNVFIDVSASINGNTYVKEYNGVTIESGYADPAMINNLDRNSCIIRSKKDNPVRVYHFEDPIDTPEQLAFFRQIIENNIMSRNSDFIPTVVLAPKISKDAESYMRRIVTRLHRYDESSYSAKPPILIITNYLGLDENYVAHIANLCGCKPIKKYIDPKIQEMDQSNGMAPTLSNVCEFYGKCGQVEADSEISKFVDPYLMYERDDNDNVIIDEDGNYKLGRTYKNLVTFLEAEYKSLSEQGGNIGTLGSLKRQLNAVKSNMVELFVGGISVSDRDSVRDLVEDAVLNTRSAAKYGVGYGANVMGLLATDELLDEYKSSDNTFIYNLLTIINNAYEEIVKALYTTVHLPEEVESIITNIRVNKCPLNITTGEYDKMVLTSIESEPVILDTIHRLITKMFTANQAVLQHPTLASMYR